MKKKILKLILKIVIILLVIVLLVGGAYLLYVTKAYHRIGDGG